MLEGRLASHADGFARYRIDRDVPEAAAGYGDARRERIEGTTVVGVPASVFETAKVRVVHQANVAGLRALDDDDVIFVEVLTLVYVFHYPLHAA